MLALYATRPVSIISGNCHKYHFCRNKTSVATSMCLSWQNTSFVVTKVRLLRQNFCCNKITFVTTKYFCRNKTVVATNICRNKNVLWQAYFCHDKRHEKQVLVTTKLSSWQKWYLWQLPPIISLNYTKLTNSRHFMIDLFSSPTPSIQLC